MTAHSQTNSIKKWANNNACDVKQCNLKSSNECNDGCGVVREIIPKVKLLRAELAESFAKHRREPTWNVPKLFITPNEAKYTSVDPSTANHACIPPSGNSDSVSTGEGF